METIARETRTRIMPRQFALRVLVVLPLCAGIDAGCTPTRSPDPSPVARVEAPLPPTSIHAYTRPPVDELRSHLTPLQFEVTQNAATERPFENAYWNAHAAGIYVDIATGEPLFSSQDKFESGTGWPSFVRPIEDGHVVEHTDSTLGMIRTEVVSKGGSSHLGHVFDDGPAPTGKRYCINSAALRFVGVDRLAAEGYGDYAPRFDAPAQAPTPAASTNTCTTPAPGQGPGCATTLDVAIFSSANDDDRIAKTIPGVLEVAHGYEGVAPAIEVTFDPAKVSYDELLTQWTSGRVPPSRIYARNAAQKASAAAKSLHPADAMDFRRAP